MKKLAIALACGLGLALNVQAGSVGTSKIFTGNHGGVVTVQKRVTAQPDTETVSSRGLVTLSDVRLEIVRDAEEEDVVRDASSSDADAASVDDAPEVSDEPVDADRVYRTRVSGHVRFMGEAVREGAKQMTINGAFRTLPPENKTLKLVEITAEVINEELMLTGTVVINDQEYDVNAAPESVQKFVRRVLWLIRSA